MKELESFLLTTGRTLSQMALYAPDHPQVQGAIAESQRLLTVLLESEPEVELSVHDGKLLVNGKPAEAVGEAGVRPFLLLMANFDLHSVTFLRGLTPGEMVPFYRLASRSEMKNK